MRGRDKQQPKNFPRLSAIGVPDAGKRYRKQLISLSFVRMQKRSSPAIEKVK